MPPAAATPAVPVVDLHAHVFLPEVLGRCGAAGPELREEGGVQVFRAGAYTIRGVRFRDSPMSDLDRRLALMDRLGIDRQVVSPYPMLFYYDQPDAAAIAFAEAHNDAAAALVARAPDRLAAFATLPMQAPQAALAELQRAVDVLGLRGAYVGARYGARRIVDADYDPLWAFLAARGLPVVVHPGPLDGSAQMLPPGRDLELIVGFAIDETLAITQLVLGGVLDRHPELVAIVPHGGGFAPFVKSRFEMALAKRPWGPGLLERPFDDVWNQLVFDCLVHDDATLRYLVEAHGAERVVLGTNFAAWDQDDGVVAQVRGLPIAAARRDAILGGNALRMLRLAPGA